MCGGSPAVMVACGEEYTLALTRAGHVWSCGCCHYGKTGQADPVSMDVLLQVPGVERIAMVAAGDHFSLAVASDGRLWSWGDSSLCPQKNDVPADVLPTRTPFVPRALEVSVFGGSRVLFVTAVNLTAAAASAAGELWAWGHDERGSLGLGENTHAHPESRAPRRVGAFAGAAVLMAACGRKHMVVLTESGVVWTCGDGSLVALGHGDQRTCLVPTRIPQDRFRGGRVVCVAAGRVSSMAVTAEGVLYSWGSGALGHGHPNLQALVLVPTAVAATLPPGARVARTSAVPRGHILTFCMGALARLGGDGCAHASASDDVLGRIAAAGRGVSGAYAHMGEGLLRLLAVRLRAAA